VILYKQRGLHERYTEENCDCIELDLFIILQTVNMPVAQAFKPADRLTNLCKSLENPLSFDLFAKY